MEIGIYERKEGCYIELMLDDGHVLTTSFDDRSTMSDGLRKLADSYDARLKELADGKDQKLD